MAGNKVAEWYKGRHIFITGGTGFMGKVLVEKILFSCNGVANVYILMRPKRGRNVEQRLDDIWKLPLFNRLREFDPNAFKKIIPVHGDLYTDNLGLSDADLKMLEDKVSVVFHCAATLKLEATLKDAIEQNTAGTQRVIDVVKRIKHLDAFIHMSTAFCSADIEVFEEKVYPCQENPRDVIQVARWMRNDALEQATKALIKPHPNTYTFSKRLAESLVADEATNMRVAIVRPAIVTPAASEPLRGWVDSLNGPMGLLVAAGKGVLRTMHAKATNRAQVVPVDIAINAMLLVAHDLGSAKEKPDVVPVYNITNDGVLSLTWGRALEIGRHLLYQYPFEMMVWYPDGDIRDSYIWHKICCFLMHVIPAYIIDFLMLIFFQKRFMIRIMHKIDDGLELLQFFATREWIFESKKFLALHDNLSEEDKKTFQMDFKAYPIEEYFKYCLLGAREYCMKEKPSTLPRCRWQLRVLYIFHLLVVYGFYFFIFWTIFKQIDKATELFDFVGSYARNIPILKSIVNTS